MRVWVLFQDYFEDRTTIGVYASVDLAKDQGPIDWRSRGAGWRMNLRLEGWSSSTPSPDFPDVYSASAYDGQDRVCVLSIEEWEVTGFTPKAA